MSTIAVVHLVRKHNGVAPFRRFLESYDANPGGRPHDFVVIFKGFDRAADLRPYNELLGRRPFHSLMVPDRGFDIVPYFHAAKTLGHQYFCFLNSFSVILDPEWLGKLYENLGGASVGIVGATGSYASHCSLACDRFKDAWRRLPRDRGARRLRAGCSIVKNALQRALLQTLFDPFPAHHIRTNAFMIRRATMLNVSCPRIAIKFDAYRFESGKNSLTNQVLRMNRRALIVGRDGHGYDKDVWHESGTLWLGTQPNLLVADNQTRQYDAAKPADKEFISRFAWGDRRGATSPGEAGIERGG